MKKKNSWFRSPVITVVAFALAAVLLTLSGIGTARAALTYFSETYRSRVQLNNIGVSLVENDKVVSHRDYNSGDWDQEVPGKLLANMLGENESLRLDKEYKEELKVRNTGISTSENTAIDEYVRVTIYKYWLKNGKNLDSLSPDLIELNLTNIGSAWVEDTAAKTKDRTVLYYTSVLPAGGETPLFADKVSINKEVAKYVSTREEKNEESGVTTIYTTYEYDGIQFVLEAKVDAVQDHNAEDAILSAWGRSVRIESDGSLSLR
ncbi:MAG: hypothetical protein IJ121_02115 [Eubacterium sp.]|nr:hypothetical protein [Eubacterium sp.]